MGSKGRLPHHHLRRPLPGPGGGHHDPFAPALRSQHGTFPPYDMLPPPEVMEQKLAAQHVEMQKLATENQRLAATHGTLRQDLAAIQHELHMLHNHVGAVKSEREQQIRGLLDKIGKTEAELQGAEPLKLELQQAREDAQRLHSAREELVSRVQQLTEDHQRAHMDLQQVPALMSELDSLRHEYQHCRATYEHEKKLYNDHLESLQVMEKNYMTMASEVEKLRAELTKYADVDRRTGLSYAGFPGYNDKEASGHYPVGQNSVDDAYGVAQGHGTLPGGAADGNAQVVAQSGAAAVRAVYDAHRGGPAVPGYDVHRGPGPGYDIHKGSVAPAYDPQRGPSGPPYDTQRRPAGPPFDPQRGPGGPYDAQRGPSGPGYDTERGPAGHGYDMYRGPGGPGYDPHRGGGGSGYDMQRGPTYDVQRGSNADAQRGGTYDGRRGSGYDAQRGHQFEGQHGGSYEVHRGTSFESPKGASGPQGQVAQQANNATYGSGTPTSRAGASGPQAQALQQANNSAYGSVTPNRGGSGFQALLPPPPPPPPADGNHPTRR